MQVAEVCGSGVHGQGVGTGPIGRAADRRRGCRTAQKRPLGMVAPCVPSPLCRERRGVAHTHTLPCLPVVELEWVCFQPEVGGGQALAVQPIHPDVASNAGQARKGEAGGEPTGLRSPGTALERGTARRAA